MNSTSGVAYAFWLDLERLRLERGWTQVELSKRSGVPRSTINRLKEAPRAPYVATVHKLADAVGMDRAEAVHRAGLHPDVTPASQDLDDLEREIEAIANSDLPQGMKDAMIREAERLADRQRAEHERFLARQAAERREAFEGWSNIARGGAQPA